MLSGFCHDFRKQDRAGNEDLEAINQLLQVTKNKDTRNFHSFSQAECKVLFHKTVSFSQRWYISPR